MTQVSSFWSVVRASSSDNDLISLADSRLDEKDAEDKGSFWSIPNVGVFGAGSALVGIVLAYKAMPEAKEYLSEIIDFFKSDKEDDTTLSEKEKIGKLGNEYKGRVEPTNLAPRISKIEPVTVGVKKPDSSTDSIKGRIATGVVTEMPRVSTSAAITHAYTSNTSSNENLPALARPSDKIRAILQNTSKTEDLDYRTLYAVVGSESSFSADATASKSSATGLLQFTTSTWSYLTKKVYPELKFTAKDRTDPTKASIVGARYIKSIKTSLSKKLGTKPTLGQVYLGYFMGPTGAIKFLNAYSKTPNAKGDTVFPAAAKANPSLFYDKKDKTPLTLSETMGLLEGKINRYYADADSVQPVKSLAVKQEVAPPVAVAKNLVTTVSLSALSAASVSPVVQAVAVPDFMATNSKLESRKVGNTTRQTKSNESSQGSPDIGSGESNQKKPMTYVRDKHKRIVAITE